MRPVWRRSRWHSRVRDPGRIASSSATETRPEPRPETLTTGVIPRRPHVRPLGGLRVNPASSSKQIHPSQAARVL
ncbi:hypothetical protein GCM10025734_04180 [Kitasatospora paranensis]